MRRSKTIHLSFWLLFFALLFYGCDSTANIGEKTQAEHMQASTSETPKRTTDFTDPLSLETKIVDQHPLKGQRILLDSYIELIFNREMDQDKTASAWSFVGPNGENIPGEISWPDANTFRFKPNTNLENSTQYFGKFSTKATTVLGEPLSVEINLEFTTVGILQVSQVFPVDGAEDVDNNSSITVIFNRPIVPLIIADEKESLLVPIEITPSITGTGEWLNSSVYVFQPDMQLTGGLVYTVNIPAGLEDTSGNRLGDDFEWQFTINSPGIFSFGVKNGVKDPEGEIRNLLLDQEFEIKFLQPMITQSVEDALLIIDRETRKELPSNFEWNEDQTEVTIRAINLLKVGGYYTLTLLKDAEAQQGGKIMEGISQRFSTVPLPRVESVEPKDGTVQEVFSSRVIIKFSSPMDFDSLEDKVVISPEPESLSYYYDNRRWRLYIYGLEPSNDYVIRLIPGMKDIYGNRISDQYSFSIKTAERAPFAEIKMTRTPLMYRVGGEQVFFIQYVNIDTATFSLYKLTDGEFASFVNGDESPRKFRGDEENLIREWEEPNRFNENQVALVKFDLTTENGGELPPGYYLLGMEAPPVEHDYKYLSARILYVANANITLKVTSSEALVWLTDLETGEPLSGVPVGVFNENTTKIAEGITNEDGIIHIDGLNKPVYARTLESDHVAFTNFYWGSGVYPGDFGVWTNYYSSTNKPVVYTYSDRPIYRPGQEVSFKGILRFDNDLDYSLPLEESVIVTITTRGDQIYRETLPLSEYGSFSGQLDLVEDAILGNYKIEVKIQSNKDPIGSMSFSVGEYRKPEFFINLTSSNANVLVGDEFTILLDADYYSGGSVGIADVNWTIQAAPYYFKPDREYQMFSFRDRDRDSGYTRSLSSYTDTLAEGAATTDEEGHFEMIQLAELTETTTSQNLEFLANVSDIGANVVGGRMSVIVHQSAVYPGVRSKKYIGKIGEEQTFEIVVLDWSSNPVPGQVVDVEIVERRWYSVQEEDEYGNLKWVTTVENIPVKEFSDLVVDEDGRTEVSFIPLKGGVYKAIVSSEDEFGNNSAATAFSWVTGSSYVSWRQTNDRSLSLILDKGEYSPGDTAEILIASPFQQETYALVTVERGNIQDQEVILLDNNSAIYELQITSEMAPIVYLSVVVVKGSEIDSTPPDFRLGMTSINVDTSHQLLNVEIDTDKETVGPGDVVTYNVKVTDYKDAPVEAEVSLALLDLASLDLVPPNSSPILSKFYPIRALSVRSALAILLNAEDYNIQLQETKPEGEYAGGGGGGALGIVDIREEFPDTAYWKGHLVTDENGEAQVTVTLPDNLTTWQMDVRAVTMDTRVGEATYDLVSVKPLFVRPQTPRFFVVGDRSRVAVLVHNTTEDSISVEVSLDAEGITLDSQVNQSVEVGGGKQEYVYWDFTVNSDAKRVDLIFNAEGGGYSDSSRPTLGVLEGQGIPVFAYYTPHTVGTAGMLTEGDTIAELISLPSVFKAGDGNLSVEISTSLAGSMVDGLEYLKEYPHYCMEQTISRFLPNVLSSRALIEAGLYSSVLKSQLDYNVKLALPRIYRYQNSDGGWGWWRNESDTLTTAYVILGLLEAEEAGFDVSASVLRNGVNFLYKNVKNIEESDRHRMPSTTKTNRQAFVYYILARVGRVYTFSVENLYKKRLSMSLYARAYLAQTLYLIDPEDQRVDTLISDFSNTAISSAEGVHWEETYIDYWNWNTDIRTTAIVLNALAEIDPDNYMNEKAIRWLMRHRDSGHWKSTQETSWVLMALTRWMKISGEFDPDYPYTVGLNGESIFEDQANKGSVSDPTRLNIEIEEMLQEQTNTLVFGRGDGPGNLYYSTYMTVTLPVEEVEPLDQGIIVSRSYYALDDLETPITEIEQGELVRVRLTIVATSTLHYVVINDPLPAGLEVLDRSLETSLEVPRSYDRQDFLDRGWGWWYFDYVDIHDEKVILSADYLRSGTYVYTYLARASTPGEYKVIPVTAEQFYFPDVSGRSAGSVFVITPWNSSQLILDHFDMYNFTSDDFSLDCGSFCPNTVLTNT